MSHSSPNPKPIILFDLDDTLCKTSQTKQDVITVIGKTVKPLNNIDPAKLFQAYLDAHKTYYKISEKHGFNTYSNITQWYNWLERLNVQATIKDITNIIDTYRKVTLNNLSLYPNVLTTLNILKQKEYILCIVSGGDYYSKAQKLFSLNIDHLFDHIFCTEFTQSDKTSGDIYKYVTEFFKRPASNFIMIGDIVEQDIKPANAVGMTTVQVTMRGDRRVGERSNEKANYVINDMGKLLEIIENVNH